ncbi:hypothetical protein ENBRE01_1614 [Enteropsectra breve]|nr:hypothetical protein ENBRE01_1614 [Enteropsectra breve]
MATRCKGLLDSHYKERHNNILRSIHLFISKNYGITSRKKLKNYKVESVIENNNVLIKTDLPIFTELKIQANKPDILIHDKIRNVITIIEIGVTNKELLKKVEKEKKWKYALLARELKNMYKCEVNIIPYVMTWEGLVTTKHAHYVQMMRLPRKIEAYIQYKIIKDTYDFVITRSNDERNMEE